MHRQMSELEFLELKRLIELTRFNIDIEFDIALDIFPCALNLEPIQGLSSKKSN